LCNIFNEFGIHVELVTPVKMCLSETHSRIRLDKHLFEMFLINNCMEKEMLYRHYFSILL
jgi:hypothetical protein